MVKGAVGVLLVLLGHTLLGQTEGARIKENRAKALQKVLSVDDPEGWKKFIRENYTKELIDKPMKTVVSDGSPQGSSTANDIEGNIEAKSGMFKMLHNDLGDASLVSITPTKDDDLEMKLQNTTTGFLATFQLRFEKNSPFKISGIGIEASQNGRR